VYPDSPRDCADPEKCFQCQTTIVGATCRFECSGKVPADEMTDADSFDIKITFNHFFTTDQPGPPGMIRYRRFFTDQWSEFLPKEKFPIS
jgi:hypothetical protein